MGLFKEVKCGRCDRRYSAIFNKCPHCGALKNRDGKNPGTKTNTRWQVVVGAVVLLAVIAAVIILVTHLLKDRPPETVPSAKPSSTAASPGVTSMEGTDPTPSALPGAEETPAPTPPPTPAPTPEPVVNSITLSKSDFTLFTVGEQYTITATVSPAGSKAAIVWISEDPDVATVDENGTVTAVDRGDVVVSATAGGVTAECIVRVRADAPKTSTGGDSGGGTGSGSFSLSHSDVTIHSASGETFKLKVKNAGEDAVVSFASDKPSVASVTSDGTVKAESNGTATITVTVTVGGETKTLECVCRVVN